MRQKNDPTTSKVLDCNFYAHLYVKWFQRIARAAQNKFKYEIKLLFGHNMNTTCNARKVCKGALRFFVYMGAR